ncbi:MAG: metallophosphoesterase family protein [Cyclobacteriaceae bacterium]
MRLAIITDIHEDIESLRRALKLAELSKVDKIYCLGDIVGFSIPWYHHFKTRSSTKCIELIKAHCEGSVIGNHDLYAIRKNPSKCRDFEFPNDWYTLDYHSKSLLSEGRVLLYDEDELNALLAKEDLEYLNQLPEEIILNTNKIVLSHFLYPDITGSSNLVKGDVTQLSVSHLNYISEKKCEIAIVGHAHSLGAYTFEKNRFTKCEYDRKIELSESGIVFCPPLVKGKNQNGVTIFDLKDREITFKQI